MGKLMQSNSYTRRFWTTSDRGNQRIHLLEHHLADVEACFQRLLAQPTIDRRLTPTASRINRMALHTSPLDTIGLAAAAAEPVGVWSDGARDVIFGQTTLIPARWPDRYGCIQLLCPLGNSINNGAAAMPRSAHIAESVPLTPQLFGMSDGFWSIDQAVAATSKEESGAAQPAIDSAGVIPARIDPRNGGWANQREYRETKAKVKSLLEISLFCWIVRVSGAGTKLAIVDTPNQGRSRSVPLVVKNGVPLDCPSKP